LGKLLFSSADISVSVGACFITVQPPTFEEKGGYVRATQQAEELGLRRTEVWMRRTGVRIPSALAGSFDQPLRPWLV
jgi:hypothetical protein